MVLGYTAALSSCMQHFSQVSNVHNVGNISSQVKSPTPVLPAGFWSTINRLPYVLDIYSDIENGPSKFRH